MCCLCFDIYPLDRLSRDFETWELTDVCMGCRMIEIGLMLRADHMYEADDG